jgi:membrane associated rhomboid family serine protease
MLLAASHGHGWSSEFFRRISTFSNPDMKPDAMPFSGMVRALGELRNARLTWVLLGLILAIHGGLVLAGGAARQPGLAVFTGLGLSRATFLDGEIWRIFSYGFLHGSGLHLAVNAAFLLALAYRIEHIAGRVILLKVWVAGILGGGLGHLVLAPAGSGADLLVGMSGGGVALLIFLTTLSPESRMMPLPVSGRSLAFGILIAELLLALVDPGHGIPWLSQLGKWMVDWGMGSWFQIGHGCHVGGWCAGYGFGRWVLRPRITQESLRRERAQREALEVRRRPGA